MKQEILLGLMLVGLFLLPLASAASVCGDVTGNGIVDNDDVNLLLNYVGYPGDYSISSEWAADVTCNGEIDIGDVVLLQNYVGYPGEYKLNCCSDIPKYINATPVPDTFIKYPQIKITTCDAMRRCEEGLECYGFPSIGLRCAERDPCSYYKCPAGTECLITASYPGSLTCSCTGFNCPAPSDAENVVSYDSVTKTVVYTVYQNEQPVSNNISLWQTTSGNTGILQTVTATVGYTGELAVEEEKLFMETEAGKKPINIMPEAAIAASETPTSATKVELKEESQQPVYSVTGTQPAKILFILPVDMEIKTKISAETGEIISVSKPWWSFLAW